MLFKGLAHRIRGGDVATRAGGPLIGDRERIVPCPGCARPLVDGQGRCPGCGLLMIAGVRLRAAGFLILVGCALGMIGGALVAGVAMAPRLAAGDAAIIAAAANATAEPAPPTAPAGATPPGGAGPAPSGTPATPAPGTDLPAGITGSFLQVAAVNDRLAAAAVELDDVLDGGSRRAADVPILLRRIAADVRAGTDAARHLGSWAPAAGLAAEASTLYTTVMAAATEGLASPLADRAAYTAAGRTVRSALDGLPAVVAGTRVAALLAGLDLPGASVP